MNTDYIITGKLALALFLQFAVLVLFIFFDPYTSRKKRRDMLLISMLVFTLLLSDMLEGHYDLNAMIFGRTVASIYGYCFRPIVLLLFLRVLDDTEQYRWLWIVVGINTILYCTAFFSGLTFQIDAANHFQRGPLGYTCHVVSGLFLLIHIREALKRENPRIRTPLLICLGMMIAAMIADLIVPSRGSVCYVTITMLSVCLIFYFTGLHIQLAEEHAQAMVNEQRIKILISQIQPHFLFNTLSTIQALCRIDPAKASEVTGKFGTYLRASIDSLSQDVLIPFSKELEHTKTFAEIECIRFPSMHMEYDIRDRDFLIPALTVQPMVENAIRHGVRSRAQGMVQVETYQDGSDHVVVIRDNGKGFDVSSLPEMPGDHIGIQNVRERLQMLCNGSMSIESRIGEGTEITFRIPESEEIQ